MDKTSAIQEVAILMNEVLRFDDASLQFCQLAERINYLLVNDFDKLISILYRMDVSEAKVKEHLKNSPGEDAGIVIASLMLERQEQRIKSRNEYRREQNDIGEEDRW